MRARSAQMIKSPGFNPHPSCLLGATIGGIDQSVGRMTVSILTQVVSWVPTRVPQDGRI